MLEKQNFTSSKPVNTCFFTKDESVFIVFTLRLHITTLKKIYVVFPKVMQVKVDVRLQIFKLTFNCRYLTSPIATITLKPFKNNGRYIH